MIDLKISIILTRQFFFVSILLVLNFLDLSASLLTFAFLYANINAKLEKYMMQNGVLQLGVKYFDFLCNNGLTLCLRADIMYYLCICVFYYVPLAKLRFIQSKWYLQSTIWIVFRLFYNPNPVWYQQ